MDYIDYKYVQLVGSRLERFHDTGNQVYAFRCPICGDSRKDLRKTRGYLLWDTGKAYTKFYCHNCGASSPLSYFLQDVAQDLYMAYKVEKFGSSMNVSAESKIEKKLTSTSTADKFADPLMLCQTLNECSGDNIIVRQYAEERKIPSSLFNELYATTDVNLITKRLDKYKDTDYPQSPMLVIPFYRNDGSFSYIQNRVATKDVIDDFRFLTLQTDEVGPKLYGESRVDWKKPVYVLEGPIDAMFITNGVANAGASSSMRYVADKLTACNAPKSNICMLFDNDYMYNAQVKQHVMRSIESGLSVVLFDDEFEGHKDINKAITSGWSISDVNYYIKKRTFQGLRAKLEISSIGKRF